MEEESYVMDKIPVKVVLALGGGGVRGLAHIGILRALSKDIPISMIAGTSMGAVVGALYALNLDTEEVEKKLFEILEKKEIKEIERLISGHNVVEEKKIIIQRLLTFVKKMYLLNLRAIKRWIFSGREINSIFDELGFDIDFKKLKIPFSCMSVDLRTGDEVIMNKGNLKEAILASISLPGVFPPVKKGNRLLVDGGVICSVPVDAAKEMDADLVIAVGVESAIDYNKKLGNGFDIMFQADAIRAYKINEMKLKTADLIILPEVGHISWASFSQAPECIKAGEKAAEKMKPQILDMIRKKRRDKFWKGFFSFPKYSD
ncbi:MAG: patatin-like phospholipase family protein [Candidatus Omnitrophica bacterium]|nr:patatin-like phospholipase family protein [Candidatus Omnitrophota bacterium]MBU1923174.1 patatin-like phospholipase family protein [Candidatus Omnitrophota bacterium]